MIHDMDRSWYIGASDTHYVVGNWATKTFNNWWDIKRGYCEGAEPNIYMIAGTLYEHQIMKHCEVENWDRQIIVGRLRVNYDGFGECPIEVKTYKLEKGYSVKKEYWQQAQVEMWASHSNMVWFIFYGLTDEDYGAADFGITFPISPDRISWEVVDRDDKWLKDEYLPKFNYLSHCLDTSEYPTKEGFERWWKELEQN